MRNRILAQTGCYCKFNMEARRCFRFCGNVSISIMDRKTWHTWVRCILMPAVAAALLADGAAAAERPGRGSQSGFLHHDGIVEFLRSDGSVAVRIPVEIADDPPSWTRGLMGRRQISDSEGMLFVYPVEQPQVFWMRNTPISLDMIFIAADGRVVRIARRTQPMSDRHYHSIYPARYVVEVSAGFADRHNIDVGTRLRWQRR